MSPRMRLRSRLRGGFAAALLAVALGLTLAPAGPALAVQPDEVLDDPALEARAREISAELRCLVCRNESIDDSNADLARDLRLPLESRDIETGPDRHPPELGEHTLDVLRELGIDEAKIKEMAARGVLKSFERDPAAAAE